MIEYSYFDDTESDDSISGRINVWQFNDAAYSERLVPRLLAARAIALAAFANDAHTSTDTAFAAGVASWERACIVVCVDLSRPDACVRSLARWLRAAQHIQSAIVSSGALSEAQQQRLRHNGALSYCFGPLWFVRAVRARAATHSSCCILTLSPRHTPFLPVSQHVQLYTPPSQLAHSNVKDEEKAQFKIDPSCPATNLGVPIVVVGCKVRAYMPCNSVA